MRSSLTILKPLLKKPSFTTAEARAHGVSASLLSYYAQKGEIEKLGRGIYRGSESERDEVPFEWEDLISTVQSIPNGRVCLISALALYELTDEIPREFWIAIPHKHVWTHPLKSSWSCEREYKMQSCIRLSGKKASSLDENTRFGFLINLSAYDSHACYQVYAKPVLPIVSFLHA